MRGVVWWGVALLVVSARGVAIGYRAVRISRIVMEYAHRLPPVSLWCTEGLHMVNMSIMLYSMLYLKL